MPRWAQSGIGTALTAFVRRYRLNAPVGEVATGILPVAQVDKHWQSDRLNVWGVFGQRISDGINHSGVGLLAGTREVIVHKVEVWIDSAGANHVFHMFTPLQGYNAFAVLPTIALPWLQMGYQGPVQPVFFPEAFVLAGGAPALQTIIVNGAGFVTTGPVYRWHNAGVVGAIPGSPTIIWGFQDPPLRLHPQQEIVVQGATLFGAGAILNVNFYFSEREPQGNVG